MRKDARIYVAGHRGLVGAAIVRRLEAAGYEKLLLRTSAELDLTDQAATSAFFAAERPEYVFLAAAKVGGIGANSTYPAEFIYENLAISMNVIEASRAAGVVKLVNLGSSCIYPRLAPQPMAEDALLTGTLEPTNEPYAIAKIAAIKLCSAYNRQYGTEFLSVMPTNLYGPGDRYDTENGHVLPVMIAKFHAAKVSGEDRVTLWGDGTPLREFLFVDDLADAVVLVMERLATEEVGEFINIGSAEEVSIAGLAGLVRDVVYADAPGRTCEIVWDTTKPNGTPRKLLDSSRMRATGWRPQTPLAEGLKVAYEDFCRGEAGRR
jgi:GDP-L-fucose synthase